MWPPGSGTAGTDVAGRARGLWAVVSIPRSSSLSRAVPSGESCQEVFSVGPPPPGESCGAVSPTIGIRSRAFGRGRVARAVCGSPSWSGRLFQQSPLMVEGFARPTRLRWASMSWSGWDGGGGVSGEDLAGGVAPDPSSGGSVEGVAVVGFLAVVGFAQQGVVDQGVGSACGNRSERNLLRGHEPTR